MSGVVNDALRNARRWVVLLDVHTQARSFSNVLHCCQQGGRPPEDHKTTLPATLPGEGYRFRERRDRHAAASAYWAVQTSGTARRRAPREQGSRPASAASGFRAGDPAAAAPALRVHRRWLPKGRQLGSAAAPQAQGAAAPCTLSFTPSEVCQTAAASRSSFTARSTIVAEWFLGERVSTSPSLPAAVRVRA